MTMEYQATTCRESIASLPDLFTPTLAGKLKAEIQFRFTGDEPGAYFLRIDEGICTFHEGDTPSPRITVSSPSEVWLAIVRKQISGSEAFLQGKLRVEGDFSLGLCLFQIFQLS
jgi:putative sterol carrier protein